MARIGRVRRKRAGALCMEPSRGPPSMGYTISSSNEVGDLYLERKDKNSKKITMRPAST